MCGILGYISTKEINQFSFEKSLDTLKSRGPNYQDIKSFKFQDKNIFLGHTRLSILDLHSSANQPMIDESNNFVIIFNGEIYNYLDLKIELEKKGYSFKTHSDTEVLLKGFIEYGQNIVDRIDGMFAFCIYDKLKQELTFARDHFGKKPLYYYIDENNFLFASELKAIINFAEVKDKVSRDELSIAKFLIYGYIPSPNSIYREIKKLEPSTTFKFDLKSFKIKSKYRYWKLEDVEINSNLNNENKIIDTLDELLNNSVQKRLISDVPLGVFLSGGVDSSLITAIMNKYTSNFDIFSVAYKKIEDESIYAKKVAEYLNLDINFGYFEKDEIEKSTFEILNYLDEPMADIAIIPLYFISKIAKDKIKVVLSGDGGDEVFGGYKKYEVQYYIEKLKYFTFLTKIMKQVIKKEPYKKFIQSFDLPFWQRQFIFGSGGFLPNEIDKYINLEEIDKDEIFNEALFYYNDFKQKDIINKSLYLDCKILLPDWYLVKGDRATMANSLEMRNPFLDKKLVEFAFSLSGGLKIKKRESKYLLKKLASRYLPKDIVYRTKKGFSVDIDTINSYMKKISSIEIENSNSALKNYILFILNHFNSNRG